jgi:outer membrane immunogenic protein
MKNVRTKLLATTALLAFSGVAYAADMPVKAPPPPPVAPVTNWTGFYVGGMVGGASMNGSCTQSNTSPYAFPNSVDGGLVPCSTPSSNSGLPSAESVVGGVRVGYDYQINRVVLGVVGDWDWTNLNSSFQSGNFSIARAGTKIDWLASFRGRVGWAFDNVLFYGTGGIAWAHIRDNASFSGTCCGNWSDQSTTTATGAVAGGGFEYRVTQNVSVVGELLWYGSFKSSASVTCQGGTEGGPTNFCFENTVNYTTNFKTDVVLGTLGVSWRF